MNTLYDRLSPELKLLVLAIRHVTRNGGRLDFRSRGPSGDHDAKTPDMGQKPVQRQKMAPIPHFDAQTLLLLATKHRLRPILLEFDRHAGFLSSTDRTRLEALQMVQVRQSLAQVHALHRVTEELARLGIDLIPMKGNLLVQELYRNNQLREMGDIDFLLQRDQVFEAVHVLKRLGYALRPDVYPQADRYQDELVRNLVASPYQSELPLSNGGFSLDVHWGVAQPHFGLPLDATGLFERAEKRAFFGAPTLMPDLSDTWWMTVTHHGGKEFWKNLRHLLELDLFEQQLATGNPETARKLDQIARESHLTDTLELGRALVAELIDGREALSSKHRKRVQRHLIPLWHSDILRNARDYWFHEIPMRWYSRPSALKQIRIVPDIILSKIDEKNHTRYPETFGPINIMSKAIQLVGKLVRAN
jgi:hypothetical protein